MHREAASHGRVSTGLSRVRKIIIRTVENLLRGVEDEDERLPPLGRHEGFRRAGRERPRTSQQPTLEL